MATPPYELSDKAIVSVNQYAVTRSAKLKRKLLVKGFDELNIMDGIDALYADLYLYAKRQYEQLYASVYARMLKHLKRKAPEEDEIYSMAEMHVTVMLSEPSDVLHYTYDTESTRKRDRAKEAVMSVKTKTERISEIDKAVRIWSQMNGWYCDLIEDDAAVQAMKDSGIKKVRRHEEMDAKTCDECAAADGEIYDIDNIPPQPHPHCRRWFIPA